MTKDMFIPHLFDMPVRKNYAGGKSVTTTMTGKKLRQMVWALESVGMVVRVVNNHYTCHASNQELLNARKGNRGTYLVRCAENVLKLTEKRK